MTIEHDAGLAALQRHGRLFHAIAIGAIAAILVVMGLTMFVIIHRWTAMTTPTLQRLALTWSPTPFYLWALWSLGIMFRTFAGAKPAFPVALAVTLVRIGWGVMLGALTTIVASPFVLAMSNPRGMTGAFASLNVPALTLGVVGLALVATAHMVRQGAAIEAEAAELKSELEGFV